MSAIFIVHVSVWHWYYLGRFFMIDSSLVLKNITIALFINTGSFRDKRKFRCVYALSSDGSHEH